jgi:hypothetical protein
MILYVIVIGLIDVIHVGNLYVNSPINPAIKLRMTFSKYIHSTLLIKTVENHTALKT